MKKLNVCISLDVEEEGLFSGAYKGRGVSVTNVPLLRQLAPLYTDYGLPLTLFCAYPVFMDKESRDTLEWMQKQTCSEIGAHLHHWSTPPYTDNIRSGEPIRTHLLDKALLESRLDTLLKAGSAFTGRQLTSFRMGRWDLKKAILPLLAERGILVDSSICPLRHFKNGPDHFLAPAEPYWVDIPQTGRILEAPITQIPLWRPLTSAWQIATRHFPYIRDKFHFFAALSANPFWHIERIMRLAVDLHVKRGGRILSLFWHSSELLPGGSPQVPDRRSADNMLAKIFRFCKWLNANFQINGVTATQLALLPFAQEFPERQLKDSGDW